MTNANSIHRLAWLLVAIAAALPFLSGLDGGFTFDDEGVILKNPAVARSASFLDPWTSPYWPEEHEAGLYRPLTNWTFWLQRRLSGDDPLPFHAVNMLLHVAASLLAFSVLRRLFRNSLSLPLFASLVFAVHPIHTEAVTGLVGRAELLGAVFGFAAYRVWLAGGRNRAFLAGASFALALAAKESAIGWLALIALHRAGLFADGRGYASAPKIGRRAMVLIDSALILGLLAYLLARLQILGAPLGVGVGFVENPLAGLPPFLRVINACKVLGIGMLRILWPAPLIADYSYRTIEFATTPFSDAGAWTLFFIALGVATWQLRRRSPTLVWSLAFYAVMIFPVSNLAVLIGTVFGERLLYLPSLGVITAICAGLIQAWRGSIALRPALASRQARMLGVALVAVPILALSVRTWTHNRVWHDNVALFANVVAHAPDNVKAQANLGTALFLAGRVSEAEPRYHRALELQPDYLPALNSLGHVRILERRYAAAESLLTHAAERYPENPEPFIRLGNLYLEIRKPIQALAAFDHLLALRPNLAEGWMGRASALFMLGRYGESADTWQRVATMGSGGVDARQHLAAALERAGRTAESAAVVEVLLAERPRDAELQASLACLRLIEGDATSEDLSLARAAAAGSVSRARLLTLVDLLVRGGHCESARAVILSNAVSLLQAAERDSLQRRVAAGCAEFLNSAGKD